MARKLDDVMATLPKDRKKRVEDRAMELATLKDLRLAVQQTQEQMAAALGVRQDTFFSFGKTHRYVAFNNAPLRGKHGRKA